MASYLDPVGDPAVKVISFLATLPSKMLDPANHDQEKPQTLIKFIEGVRRCGDEGILHTGADYQHCDVAVMLGWVHEHGKLAPHLSLRQTVLDQQYWRGGRTLIADSNLFLYKDTKNPHHYLRYSFDGVFPTTGEYCDAQPDPERWHSIKRDLGVDLRPWRDQGAHILMCLQRDGGWSMAGFDVVDWALITTKQLRQHTNRPIRIRAHPGDKKANKYCQEIMRSLTRHGIKDVDLSPPNQPLTRDFKHCWAVICHNSSPGVAAAIEGIPVFLTDPDRSQAREVANTDLAAVENPVMPDRTHWIHRISQSHWSHADLASGAAWQHMKKWATK